MLWWGLVGLIVYVSVNLDREFIRNHPRPEGGPAMHQHNADPAEGKVCSHLITDEMLVGWGIITERKEKCVGIDSIKREGNAAGKHPTHSAWVAGHVRICTIDRTVGGAPWIGRIKVDRSPEHIAEAFAWAESVLRPKDRRAS